MSKPLLILVNGLPATGKTTLSRRLAKDLDLPCLGKDDIKEFLFEHIEINTVERSKDVGAVAFELLYTYMEKVLEKGLSIVVECPFYYEFGRPRIEQIIASAGATCVEVYCESNPGVRKRRFQERYERGERHPSHFDAHHIRSLNHETDEEVAAKYAPLALGQVIKLDTTEFSEEAYKHMLKTLRDAIQYEGDAAKGANHA